MNEKRICKDPVKFKLFATFFRPFFKSIDSVTANEKGAQKIM